MLPDIAQLNSVLNGTVGFNGHPPLRVNATCRRATILPIKMHTGFNGHPPLRVNATENARRIYAEIQQSFNGHPPLRVNATRSRNRALKGLRNGFNGHPPLRVNATWFMTPYPLYSDDSIPFQWAPTLEGECYTSEYDEDPFY